MLTRLKPEIGCWYEDNERDCIFEVVSLDEDSVAIQYFEGELEEFELEVFLRLPLKTVDQPEDWTGPYEIDMEEMDESESSLIELDKHYHFDGYDEDTMQFIDEV